MNHAASGLATYANFAIYGDWVMSPCTSKYPDPEWCQLGCGDPIWNGVAGLNNRSYGGSAAVFVPEDPVASNMLYAVMVVRALEPRQNEAEIVLTWGYGTLETANDINGPWAAVSGAMAPLHALPLNPAATFCRVKMPCVCLPMPNPSVPLPSPYLGADCIPYDYPVFVGYRAYLNPATRSGPSYNDIIPDRVLWFKLR